MNQEKIERWINSWVKTLVLAIGCAFIGAHFGDLWLSVGLFLVARTFMSMLEEIRDAQ
jgi:hypothetical protein